MSPRSESFDYEPIVRRRRSGLEEVVEFNSAEDSSVPPLRRAGSLKKSVAEDAPSNTDNFEATNDSKLKSNGEIVDEATEHHQQSERWIFKHGHSLSFAGLFLFTAWVYFRPYELFPSLTILRTGAFWIAVATLIFFIPTQLGLENRLTIRTREVNYVLLLLAAALLSILFALDRMRAWNGVFEYLKVVLMFIVMVNVVRTEKRLKALILLALVASCYLSVVALNDYRLGKFVAVEDGRIVGAIGGLFSNPNDLALHLVSMIPLAVGLLLGTKNVLSKLLYLLSAFLFTGGVVVTFSRSGFLGLICAIGVLVWKLSPRNRVIFAIMGAVMIGGILILAPGGYRSRLSTTSDESSLARTDDLKRSVYITLRHPIFGIGVENYIIYSNNGKATHNAYTQVSAEMGVIAFIVYLMFIIVPLRRLQRIEREKNGKRPPWVRYLMIGLQASLLSYMVTSFFASVALNWYVYYLVAYAVCLRRISTLQDLKAVSTPHPASLLNGSAPSLLRQS